MCVVCEGKHKTGVCVCLFPPRRKAEEDRVRKEEEKVRRELIKQEYLRRKQQELIEEQGLVKPRPRCKARKIRPKSLHRGESCSDTGFSKGSSTRRPTLKHYNPNQHYLPFTVLSLLPTNLILPLVSN